MGDNLIIKSSEEKDVLMTEPNLTNGSGKEILGKDSSRPATVKTNLNMITESSGSNAPIKSRKSLKGLLGFKSKGGLGSLKKSGSLFDNA